MMDILNNDTENLFSLPVAYLFQNGTSLNSLLDFPVANNSSVAVEVENDRKTAVVTQRTEKIGDYIKRELKWGFILHAYGFGCLFFILAFYTFFSVLNLRSFISSRPFMSTINGFLCLLGASRAGSLFIDPYSLKELMPKIIGQILWDLGFPSIISAFCLVQLAFLQLTQLKIGPEGLRRKSCLSLIVTAHFTLTIGIDLVVASHESLMVVKYVIQYIFLTWGVFLCCNFLYCGYKVMSMIRNIPGAFKHRDLPDPNHKGIMQLAMLAPYNNLAGSVTAALLPTLCTPKIHQQDNTSTSTMGFRNDGNSRILESESIPMLEEMAGSSGDERSPQPLTRGSSFQNQTRNSQKFNLKPKLSLKSSEDSENNDEKPAKHLSPRSPKTSTPKSPSIKSPSIRSNKFDFNVKPGNGILKNTETFVTTKDITEFKSKVQQRTSFENENFRFPSEDKAQSESRVENPVIEVRPASPSEDNSIPNILISCPSRRASSENLTEQKEKKDEIESDPDSIARNEEDFNKIINQIREDLKQMDIEREGVSNDCKVEAKSPQKTESKKGGSHLSPEVHGRLKGERKIIDGRRQSDASRRGSQASEIGSRRNSYRRDSNNLVVEAIPSRRSSDCSGLSEITECEDTPTSSPVIRGRRKPKSLTWKKKILDEKVESNAQDCLLPQDQGSSRDLSLSAILNHIAYVNRAALSTDTATQEDIEKIRKSKVEWVLNVTYITAMWGLMLCLSNMGRIYSPYGVPEPHEVSFPTSISNSTHMHDMNPPESGGLLSSPWPWLWFQTFCRALELAMGCAMANITRQPTASHRNPHALTLRHRDTLYNI